MFELLLDGDGLVQHYLQLDQTAIFSNFTSNFMYSEITNEMHGITTELNHDVRMHHVKNIWNISDTINVSSSAVLQRMHLQTCISFHLGKLRN